MPPTPVFLPGEFHGQSSLTGCSPCGRKESDTTGQLALTPLVGMYIDIATMKTVWRFLKKLEIKPPYDPAIPILGIHPEQTKIQKDTCTPMFTAALLTTARTWKQPRCPSTDERIKKL